MKISYLALILALIGISVWSCDPDDDTEEFVIDFGYEYFPLEIGKFMEYRLDSVIFDTTSIGVTRDTNVWFAREEVVDTFRDLSNELNYRIERSQRKSSTDPWEIESVYAAILKTDQAIRIEDNFRFIKMVFPLRRGDIWDGNIFIDDETIITIAGESIEMFKSWSYELDELDEQAVVNNMPFDSVATIFQANNQEGPDPNLIELRFSKEQYAKNLGLIYREMRILDTQCIADCINDPWEDKAQKGFILFQTLIDHN